MEEWKIYKLGDVCSRLRSGKGIKSDFISDEGTYPVIGGNGIRGYTETSNFKGSCGVIGRQGAYCGNVRFFEGEAYMTEHAVIVVGNEIVDTHYLTCLLSLMHLGNLSAQSAQPGLSVQTLSKQLISLPNIEQQKQVSAIIKSLDDKIALNTRINDNLEQQAQALYKSWFVDFEPFKDGKFVDSELGRIPEGWRVSSLESVACIIKTTISPFNFPNEVFEHYSIPAYDTNMMASYERGITILSNKYKINSNCVLLSKLNPRIKRVWLPICKTTNSICSTEFVAYRPIIDAILPYLYTLISSPEFYGFILSLTNGSTGSHQRFQPQASLGYIFAIPSLEIIYEFSKVIAPILSNKYKNQLEIESLTNLRDSLLPKLMSGKLKINNI